MTPAEIVTAVIVSSIGALAVGFLAGLVTRPPRRETEKAAYNRAAELAEHWQGGSRLQTELGYYIRKLGDD